MNITSCGISFGVENSFSRECASSGNTAHTTHAVFFPWPRELDTVSEPVNAWNIGNACVFSSPSPAASSWAARNRKFSPVLDANQSSCSCCKVWTTATTSTTTLVSTVWIMIFWGPFLAAWATCWNMWLLSSSCIQGAIEDTSRHDGLLRTSLSYGATNCLSFFRSHFSGVSERKEGNSVLLLLTLRKFLPVPGNGCHTSYMPLHPSTTFCSYSSFQRLRKVPIPHQIKPRHTFKSSG